MRFDIYSCNKLTQQAVMKIVFNQWKSMADFLSCPDGNDIPSIKR